MKSSVLKFGGTSMGSADSINRSADIVSDIDGNRAVVVSATSGTTNQLESLGNEAVVGGGEQQLNSIIDRHESLISDLKIDLNLSDIWEEISYIRRRIEKCAFVSPEIADLLSGFGERISARIFSMVLDAKDVPSRPVDAYSLIFTDNNFGAGEVDFEKTIPEVSSKLSGVLYAGVTPVITGFIAQAENGNYITLGRGGSDYSAAIVAAALDSSELQIWTDVDGIYNANPAIIPQAKPLEAISFGEAAELGYFGAKVLHPKTIVPAREKNIPVRVLNTFNPEAPGTHVLNTVQDSIKSVAYKENITIVNICSARMLNAHGFLAKIFEIFARYGIVVDVISTSEVSVSLTLDNGIPSGLLKELEEFSTVSVQKNMAIVCLVGNGINSNAQVLGRLFSNLNGHVVSMVSQGASMRNITFLVDGGEVIPVVRKVFNTFFNSNTHE